MRLKVDVLVVLLAIVGFFLIGFSLHKKSVSTSTTLPVITSQSTLNIVNLPNFAAPSPSEPSKPIEKQVSNKIIHNLTLNNDNTLLLIGPIGAENSGLTAQAITEMSQKGNPIYLVINSPGGSVLDGALIVSAIQASKVPVNTVCIQLCASMAATIFEYGTERYMVDRSILMFHEAAGDINGPFNQINSRFNMFKRMVDKFNVYIANKSNMDFKEFTSKLPNELWLDAEDAVNAKFADKYANLNFNVNSDDGIRAELLKSPATTWLDKKISITLGKDHVK